MFDDDISQRQWEYLDFMQRFEHRHGYLPTFKDIAIGLKVTSKGTVSDMIGKLDQMGLVKRAGGLGRATRPTNRHPVQKP